MALREPQLVGVARSFEKIASRRRNCVEKLWRNLFSEPAQWVDNRAEKVNPKYPDFKHVKTQDALWVIDKSNPPWVGKKLAALPPGTLQVDQFTWYKRLARHAKGRNYEKVFTLFDQMLHKGIIPDSRMFLPVINACSGLRALKRGRDIHHLIRQSGFDSDVYVQNCLIDMYAKCGSMEDSQRLFNEANSRDVVTWNSLLMGYVNCGLGEKALEMFWQMQNEGVDPDHITFISLLNACANANAPDEGRRLHGIISQRGYESDIYVASSLVNMYAKCESIEEAWEVFCNTSRHDVVLWNAMILGLVKCGQVTRALELSRQMRREKIDPDLVTFLGILNACASIVALEEGRRVHECVIRCGFQSDVYVGSSLIDMYSKCGCLDDAFQTFKTMQTSNVVVWNAMISGYAMHGRAEEALQHFERMCQEGVDMDSITFGSLLSACSHGGLVEEGLHYLEIMSTVYFMPPAVEHYSCMVDLLGRSGRLHEAEYLIAMMQCEANESAWTALLGACRVHGNVDIAERAAKHGLQFDSDNADTVDLRVR